MFELADRLVGIYKTYNCTKTITINPKLYDNTGPAAEPAPPSGAQSAPSSQAVTLGAPTAPVPVMAE